MTEKEIKQIMQIVIYHLCGICHWCDVELDPSEIQRSAFRSIERGLYDMWQPGYVPEHLKINGVDK